MYNLVSFLGIFLLVGFGWLISTDRRRMNWRAIGWGIGLQLLFALFVFRVPAGVGFFRWVNDAVIAVLGCASAGTEFVFGPLAKSPGPDSPQSLGLILATQAFPTIVFFSALTAVLYYYGILPLIIRGFSYAFTKLMRISGAESLCAASNIFVGIESALTIKPHLGEMTRSELCTVLTAGMATVASSVMAVYVGALVGEFPYIAGHLVSASILSAPAAVVMSKVLLPESETPKTLGVSVRPHYEREATLFEAVINGANAGVRLVVGIVALLLAVLGLIALVDLILGGVGGWANGSFGWKVEWSLTTLLGWLFYPFTLALGVPLEDVGAISVIIGKRAVATEVPAYYDLAAAVRDGVVRHPRSAIIATYALCGFAHVASVAIFVGGVSALAPSRTGTLARIGFRALVAATLACLMTACAAGVFCTEQSMLLGG
ncbi:MAG TPA: nucleoside transporter C-terminal domain-containing protein [Sumerlaeia bacterium]|nr:nucleoside transporter C-terminal domain-containing protein [Sumerlaeia bacterium]